MARHTHARFTRPGQYIFNMLVFLLAVGAVVYYLSPLSPQPTNLLLDAFNANQALNGLILFVLLVGVIYNLRQAGVVEPAARWAESVDRKGRYRHAPGLVSAVSRALNDQHPRDAGLTTASVRAMLDSVGTRIDEGRELGRYLMNLLVFLGLLGTFWGLLETVNAVAATINGLSTGGAAEDAVAQLITNLQEPLSGMGTAFSSSLFGLGGSLVVGFLDLQAGSAQNRFYNDLEEWLSDPALIDRRGSQSASMSEAGDVDISDLAAAFQRLEDALTHNADAQIKANASQSAELKDEVRALNRTLIRVGGGE